MSAEVLKAPKKSKTQRDTDKVEHNLQSIVNSLSKSLELVDATDSTLDRFESVFDHANTLDAVIKSVAEMADVLSNKITDFLANKDKTYSNDEKSKKTTANSNDLSTSNYESLEKVLQKYESEIREHIRMEQQLKIYSESLEERIEKLETSTAQQVTQIEELELDKQRLQRELRSVRTENAFQIRKGDSGIFTRVREAGSSASHHTKTGSMDQVS